MSGIKKILVVVYQFSPYRGSEYSVAWNYVNTMSADHHLTVIYGVNGNHMGDFEPVEDYYKKLAHPKNVKLVPLAPAWLARLFNYPNRHKVWGWSFYLAYHQWHRQLKWYVRQLSTKEKFDLIHFAGPIGYREPGFLWQLEFPYMWGPISGFGNSEKVFSSLLPPKTAFKYRVRNFINYCQMHFSRRIRRAITRADVLLAATSQNQQLIEKIFHRKVEYLPENGIFEYEIHPNALAERNFNAAVLQFFWCGKLNGAKNLQTTLHALAKIKDEISFQLHVVGTGPLKKYFRQMAHDLDLNDSIVWHGLLPRSEVLKLWQTAHLHLFSSAFEGNPTVILEALCNGVPTICFDICGMHDTVTESAGVRIPVSNFEQMTQDFADAILSFTRDRAKLKAVSENALHHAYDFSFSERRKFFNRQYDLAIKNFTSRNH